MTGAHQNEIIKPLTLGLRLKTAVSRSTGLVRVNMADFANKRGSLRYYRGTLWKGTAIALECE